MAGNLYHAKSKIKVQLGFFSIENAEIRYDWGVILMKILK